MAEPDPKKIERVIELREIPGPDFTTYLGSDFEEHLPPDALKDGKAKRTDSHPCTLLVSSPESEKPVYCRALACRAYGGKFWSVTLRCEVKNRRAGEDSDYQKSLASKLKQYAPHEGGAEIKLKDFLGYCPKGHRDYSEVVGTAPPLPEGVAGGDEKPEEIFLNDIHTLCRLLKNLLIAPAEAGSHHGGLIAITGATDSSKSLITRGLIFLILEEAAKAARKAKQRKPHLVTFEDPIEQYYLKLPTGASIPDDPETLISLLDALYLDYTPREKGTDAESLKQVTKDALRQTPAVLFVGETREKDDWKDLVEFAGSGHLVVTTSHASSVVEAMSGIFRATDANTPARRSEIARRILGIINVRSFLWEANPKGPHARALLPALWKRTSHSMNNLIADGLASILPLSRQPGVSDDIGCYGRSHFARELTAHSPQSKSLLARAMLDLTAEERDKALAAIRKKAVEWDIKGV